MHRLVIYFFSFFLAFGLYDPFNTNGLYFDFLTVLAIISIVVKNNINIIFKRNKIEIITLLVVVLSLFFSASIYGVSYKDGVPINFKLISAIIIFVLFSTEYGGNKREAIWSIYFFAISCGVISTLYSLGFLDNQFQINNGRLIIFDENPNSISSRMALGFIILYYFLFNEKKVLGKYRYVSILFFLPIINFIIATGSRGSFIILIISLFAITFLAKIKLFYKLLLGVITLSVLGYIFMTFVESSLFERFMSQGLLDSREDLWRNALSIALKNPVFGVGEEGYWIEMHKITSRVLDTHNLFIYLLVCGGAITLFAFLFFILRLYKKSYFQLKEKNILPMIFLFFFIFLMVKTGGIITYLVMWYFLAVINSYSAERI